MLLKVPAPAGRASRSRPPGPKARARRWRTCLQKYPSRRSAAGRRRRPRSPSRLGPAASGGCDDKKDSGATRLVPRRGRTLMTDIDAECFTPLTPRTAAALLRRLGISVSFPARSTAVPWRKNERFATRGNSKLGDRRACVDLINLARVQLPFRRNRRRELCRAPLKGCCQHRQRLSARLKEERARPNRATVSSAADLIYS
jgi:hypothetical protein